ncbi:MAG TPA: aminotransferase class I/II-fold pyridoxal phosphate-dependent enzyme, partial [Candidatus Dormibacteraeota bacterium]|nr:aminotransferase class I/II-fold pyridoxal phosphate-dependent enzyme [Candidatus Dormibacteraeota bacterium]
APSVQAALERFVDRQDYGYGTLNDNDALFEAFAAWMSRRHGWSPDPGLTMATADVVQGITATLVAYSRAGDGVIAQTPVYPPFLRVVAGTGRRLIENRLISDADGRYTVDTEGLRQAATDARVLLLCNPHNPTGRVFERQELEGIAAIAAERELIIVADEIHADLTYGQATHIPMETIPGAAERTVTLTSATKGFNIPGVRTAVLHFGSEALRSRFTEAIPDHLLGRPSRFGVDATIAAWSGGETWLGQVLEYLEGNRRLVAEWAEARPRLGHRAPEATFLSWLDCRGLDLPASPHEFFLESARVALSDGRDFGSPGEGHVRLNFGTSREILEAVLARMSRALDEVQA